jgi:very-short-patch-repair endonuclease
MRVTFRSHARSRRLEEHAARMRHDATASEARLFALLRGGQLGVAFRRQVPLLGKVSSYPVLT